MGQVRDAAQRWSAAFEEGDVDLAAELAADDCTVSMPGTGPMDAQTFFGVVLPMWLRAFGQDRRQELLDVVEDGQAGLVRVRFTATNTGPMATPQGEVPATGRPVTLEACAAITLRDGRIASWDVYFDQMALLTQLGVAATEPVPA